MTNSEYVCKLTQMFHSKSRDPKVYENEDCMPYISDNLEYSHLEFYQVGQNASHSFYLAVDGEKVYYLSFGERYNSDTDEVDVQESIHLLKKDIQKDPVYLGHW